MTGQQTVFDAAQRDCEVALETKPNFDKNPGTFEFPVPIANCPLTTYASKQ